jgi:hypothetical protein
MFIHPQKRLKTGEIATLEKRVTRKTAFQAKKDTFTECSGYI